MVSPYHLWGLRMQDRRNGYWQLGPLVAICIVAGGLGWLIWLVQGRSVRSGVPADWWMWIERLSWISGVSGVFVGVLAIYIGWRLALPQLRHIADEQEKLRQELQRLPVILIGFPPGGDTARTDDGQPELVSHTTILPHGEEGVDDSHPIGLHLRLVNVGTHSARECLWNLYFPPGVAVNVVAGPGDEMNATPTVDGFVRVRGRVAWIHPNTNFNIDLNVKIPSGLPGFPIKALWQWADAKSAAHTQLHVAVLAS